MNILICPDKFKGSLSGEKVALNIQKGINKKKKEHSICIIPMADGGEGTANILAKYLNAHLVPLSVKNPLGRSIQSNYFITKDQHTAIIEMASASGWELLSEQERDPKRTNSIGTGELIKDARKKGVKEIILCIGGSATNDGGAGVLYGMGYTLKDAEGNSISPTGSTIGSIVSIIAPDIKWPSIVIAHDVENPLLGPHGATYTYAEQKGAASQDLALLEQEMQVYNETIERITGRNYENQTGMGAAGGLPLSLKAFLDAKLIKGFDLISVHTELEKRIIWADLVITGEGKLDGPSKNGKVVGEIEKLCIKFNRPLTIICGKNENYATKSKVVEILPLASTLSNSMKNAEDLIQEVSGSLF